MEKKTICNLDNWLIENVSFLNNSNNKNDEFWNMLLNTLQLSEKQFVFFFF